MAAHDQAEHNMPSEILDEAAYNDAVNNLDEDHQRIDVAPTIRQQLGPFTAVCLILNRTIGSGIYATPGIILKGTGSVGVSLLFWAFGGVVGTCGLLVWLELGLSVPFHRTPNSDEPRSVPRSGGEKNYLEFIFPKPEFLATCMYGIVFILMGNLSGNAIAFGIYVTEAAGQSNPAKSDVLGAAVAVLTTVVLLHVCSRRGGILVNNIFAVVKVLFLITIIVLGFIKASGHRLGGAPNSTENFDQTESFSSSRHAVSDYTDSFLYVVNSYSGFKQPFYVLSEFSRPRKVFPKYTLIAMLITTILFVLVNVAYFCAVPKDMQLDSPEDMATLFFSQMFGDAAAKQAMAAMMAFSLFGNIIVMTFTASRVKQEIAKEGILPFSLFFATGHTTPDAWIKAKWRSETPKPAYRNLDNHAEQSPMAALGLHWITSLILIAATSMLAPSTAYYVLVTLYGYVMTLLVGFFVSGGLLYLKLDPRKDWSSRANFRSWIDPLHAIIYFVACGFLLVAAFTKPSTGSPYSYAVGHIQWYLIPTIGISSLVWGLFWYLGLNLVMLQRRKKLVVKRVPLIVPDEEDEDQWVQKCEFVDHEWHT